MSLTNRNGNGTLDNSVYHGVQPFVTLWDFVAPQDGFLSFNRGDVIDVDMASLLKSDSSKSNNIPTWLWASLDCRTGYVPSRYLEPVDDFETTIISNSCENSILEDSSPVPFSPGDLRDALAKFQLIQNRHNESCESIEQSTGKVTVERRAIFEYKGSNVGDLSLYVGAQLVVLNHKHTEDGWCWGYDIVKPDVLGWFPKNFTEKTFSSQEKSIEDESRSSLHRRHTVSNLFHATAAESKKTGTQESESSLYASNALENTEEIDLDKTYILSSSTFDRLTDGTHDVRKEKIGSVDTTAYYTPTSSLTASRGETHLKERKLSLQNSIEISDNSLNWITNETNHRLHKRVVHRKQDLISKDCSKDSVDPHYCTRSSSFRGNLCRKLINGSQQDVSTILDSKSPVRPPLTRRHTMSDVREPSSGIRRLTGWAVNKIRGYIRPVPPSRNKSPNLAGEGIQAVSKPKKNSKKSEEDMNRILGSIPDISVTNKTSFRQATQQLDIGNVYKKEKSINESNSVPLNLGNSEDKMFTMDHSFLDDLPDQASTPIGSRFHDTRSFKRLYSNESFDNDDTLLFRNSPTFKAVHPTTKTVKCKPLTESNSNYYYNNNNTADHRLVSATKKNKLNTSDKRSNKMNANEATESAEGVNSELARLVSAKAELRADIKAFEKENYVGKYGRIATVDDRNKAEGVNSELARLVSAKAELRADIKAFEKENYVGKYGRIATVDDRNNDIELRRLHLKYRKIKQKLRLLDESDKENVENKN